MSFHIKCCTRLPSIKSLSVLFQQHREVWKKHLFNKLKGWRWRWSLRWMDRFVVSLRPMPKLPSFYSCWFMLEMGLLLGALGTKWTNFCTQPNKVSPHKNSGYINYILNMPIGVLLKNSQLKWGSVTVHMWTSSIRCATTFSSSGGQAPSFHKNNYYESVLNCKTDGRNLGHGQMCEYLLELYKTHLGIPLISLPIIIAIPIHWTRWSSRHQIEFDTHELNFKNAVV